MLNAGLHSSESFYPSLQDSSEPLISQGASRVSRRETWAAAFPGERPTKPFGGRRSRHLRLSARPAPSPLLLVTDAPGFHGGFKGAEPEPLPEVSSQKWTADSRLPESLLPIGESSFRRGHRAGRTGSFKPNYASQQHREGLGTQRCLRPSSPALGLGFHSKELGELADTETRPWASLERTAGDASRCKEQKPPLRVAPAVKNRDSLIQTSMPGGRPPGCSATPQGTGSFLVATQDGSL